MEKCKICGNNAQRLFQKQILNKYMVSFYQCMSCRFAFTEAPYWLAQSYQEAITSTDLGLVKRNLYLATVVEEFILLHLDSKGKFLDFAGGYGLLVRILRDAGFDFYREDEYCKNIFATGFDVTDLPKSGRWFEMVTAFEVFEHLQNPLLEIKKMLEHTGVVLFSTELVPDHGFENWWYLGLNTGQHISFYSYESLDFIAKHFKLHLYSNRRSIHILSENELKEDPFASKNMILRWLKRRKIDSKKKELTSLLSKDVESLMTKEKEAK